MVCSYTFSRENGLGFCLSLLQIWWLGLGFMDQASSFCVLVLLVLLEVFLPLFQDLQVVQWPLHMLVQL